MSQLERQSLEQLIKEFDGMIAQIINKSSDRLLQYQQKMWLAAETHLEIVVEKRARLDSAQFLSKQEQVESSLRESMQAVLRLFSAQIATLWQFKEMVGQKENETN